MSGYCNVLNGGLTPSPTEFASWSPEERAENRRKAATNVFGADHKVDPKTGQPIEQGIGSPGRETENHFKALEKAEGREVADKARAEAAARKRGQT
jgi:hypothetical protein